MPWGSLGMSATRHTGSRPTSVQGVIDLPRGERKPKPLARSGSVGLLHVLDRAQDSFGISSRWLKLAPNIVKTTSETNA